MEEHLQLEPDAMGGMFWEWDLPLQIWMNEDGTARIVNYMARKERCADLVEDISPEDLPAICRNAARVLRNLAELFDLRAEGKIEVIYYPNESPKQAMADAGASK